MPLGLTLETAGAWVVIITALVAALSGAIVSVIAALRGEKTAGTAEALSKRVEAQSQSLRAVRTDLTGVAAMTVPPAAAPPARDAPKAEPWHVPPPGVVNYPAGLTGHNPLDPLP